MEEFLVRRFEMTMQGTIIPREIEAINEFL